MFLLMSCHLHFKTFRVLYMVKVKERKKERAKHITKKLAKLITSLAFSAIKGPRHFGLFFTTDSHLGIPL